MTSLSFRPGSKQDPSYAHEDGTHSVLVTDIIQRGTASQIYRALTDPASLAAWTGEPAGETSEGVRWSIAEFGLSATTAELVLGERVAVTMDCEGWPTRRSVAEIRLWPTPRATMLVVTHRGLSEADLEHAREMWAPRVLDRMRWYICAVGPQSSPVGVVDRGERG
ncbi:SRPBCC domain-containing protein [Streptosporangium sp. NPDC023615]|uniref:SRPBCC family protein n=1 Tax=Streptosporangium sp. NPDC023615 TaxID=3154794 RepID=UPI00341A437A